jgi:hypothetical protein
VTDEIEAKKQALETVRQAFIELMNVVVPIPSAKIQKQQALLRFDEAHMWIQNGIMSFVKPMVAPLEPVPANETPSEPEGNHAIVDNEAVQEQTAVA